MGDRILRVVAEQLRGGTRPYDLLYRYGGEEFLLCLPGTTLDVATQVLERIRLNITKTVGSLMPAVATKVTCTFGVTEMVVGETVEEAIARADEALYDGKSKGRNRTAALSDKQ